MKYQATKKSLAITFSFKPMTKERSRLDPCLHIRKIYPRRKILTVQENILDENERWS